jgi:hypothetical protein
MTLPEARERVRNHRILAAVMLIISLIVSVMAILKGFYASVQQDAGFSAALFSGIQQLIVQLYVKTQFLSWLLKIAPTPTINPLNVPDNYVYLLSLCLAVISTRIWGSASNLSRRIGAVMQSAEEAQWRQSLPDGRTATTSNGTLSVEINLVSEDQWYKRPLGYILITAVAAVIAQWLNLKFGFSKL